ncbi:MAG: hypothetical protein K0R51_1091 [Cytophagaceae bacterium]|nr:hypothetical protein [Cytophagaceae bacterium]
MRLFNVKLIVFFFLTFILQTAKSQHIENNKPCSKRKVLRDFKQFVFFCQNNFDPDTYFQSDTLCLDCVKKDFKKFKLKDIHKHSEIFDISFTKNYSKRHSSFLNIYLLLNSLNKKSSAISFSPYTTKDDFSNTCYMEVLGKPIGYDEDSSTIFWNANKKGFFELKLNERTLNFYTNDYEEIDFDFLGEFVTSINDRIIVDSLPKLPVYSALMKGLDSNNSFYKDTIFSIQRKMVFEFSINSLSFCRQEINFLSRAFVLQNRAQNDFPRALDYLQNECFKKANLYRGASIKVDDQHTLKDKRIKKLCFSIPCLKRPYDNNESNKKERIINTLNYLIENSKTEFALSNSKEIITDFINGININEDKKHSIKKDNYLIEIDYRQFWFTVYIKMPKSYRVKKN